MGCSCVLLTGPGPLPGLLFPAALAGFSHWLIFARTQHCKCSRISIKPQASAAFALKSRLRPVACVAAMW
jgi:hypothetical protein